MSLPASNLGFNLLASTLGNGISGGMNLSASVLFYDSWTAPNGIIGYGQTQNSGADRIANVPASSQVNLSDYLYLNVVGDNSAIGSGGASYWTYWDNQLTGAGDDLTDLYFRLYDSTNTTQLIQDYQSALAPTTIIGPTTIGAGTPLVHYAYWYVEFHVNKPATDPFTFEIWCSTDDGANYTQIFSINQSWTQNTTYAFAWDDGAGNLSVETANPTYGYAFQFLFF